MVNADSHQSKRKAHNITNVGQVYTYFENNSVEGFGGIENTTIGTLS